MKNISTFKIGKTLWEVKEYSGTQENNFEGRFTCSIFKNGRMFSCLNGCHYETANEAEINILFYYSA